MTKVESDPIESIDHNNNNKNGKKRAYVLRPKIFQLQDSYMCRTLANKDMKSAYHLILAFVLFFFIANAFYLYADPDTFMNEFNFAIASFQHLELFLIQHISYLGLILTVHYSITKLWIKFRTEYDNRLFMIDTIYTLIMGSIFAIIHLISISTIIKLNINIVMSIAITTDCIRISMKAFAFILESKNKQDVALTKEKKEIQFITRKQLLYYLFAPTLVYRDEYPRLEKRDYKMLLKMTIQYCICLYFLLIIQCRIFYPIFSRVGLEPIDSKTLIIDLAKVFLGSSACCLLSFYGFLHLYLNICSQIFLFGDRVFYEDWWSCTDFSTYYRKWNILVHDWIHAYLYTPSVHIFKGNQVVSGIVVIYISALAHEVILATALRQVTPILTILFAGFGVLLFVLSKLTKLTRFKKAKKEVKELASNGNLSEHPKFKKEIDVKSFNFAMVNTLFLLSIFNGWFMMITIYGVGYFSSKNCMGHNSSLFPTYSNKCLKIRF